MSTDDTDDTLDTDDTDTLEELLEDGGEDIDDELFGDGAEAGDELFEDADDVLDDSEGSPDEDEAESTVPLDVSEDGDDEIADEPPVDLAAIEGLEVDDPVELAAEEDEDATDTIREGEFVCSSCHMAKRSSALADADEMLCRDCV
jgi:hypothetical protein